jgi:16S rRNA (uracil1498-N3)-methyltransferase
MTELGVDEIVPWSATRSVVQWRGARGDKALQRWRRAAREAAKQSRRAWIPDVPPVVGDDAALDRTRTAACTLILHEDAPTPMSQVALPASGEIIVVVGPEGGITPEEIAAFEGAGAVPVRLGGSVLRTSTAGSAALAALSLRLGRWN